MSMSSTLISTERKYREEVDAAALPGKKTTVIHIAKEDKRTIKKPNLMGN